MRCNEGTLEKRGRGRGIGFTKPWASRFVLLNTLSCVLQYFDSVDDQENGRQPKGEILLNAGGSVKQVAIFSN
jgi:hypothetical protein